MADPVEVREIVKLRFQLIDTNLDALIDSYIREIGRRIRHYCNRSNVPMELTDVWASMVMDVLRIEQAQTPGIAEHVGGELNVKIGDTSVAPATRSGEVTTANKAAIDKIVLNYNADLRRYRRLGW